MDGERRKQLEAVMAALVDDEAAVLALYEGFGEEVRAVVRFEAGRRAGLAMSADDLEAMTFDACLAVARVAGGWRPDGGALPWVWARARINAAVRAYLPAPANPLPSEEELPPAPPVTPGGAEADVDVTLRELAAGDPVVALLVDALQEAVGGADAEVLLRYRMQQQAGDPSAAVTLGRELGLQPPAVRQRVSRARRRLQAHVEANPRYAPISDLPLLASPAA